MEQKPRKLIRKVWETKDCKLPLVVSDSSWRFIDDFQDFNSCKGVFIFSTSSHQVRYVGYGNDQCVKEAIADAINANNDKNCALVKVLYTTSAADAKRIAKILIEKYQPANNIDLPIEEFTNQA